MNTWKLNIALLKKKQWVNNKIKEEIKIPQDNQK